MNRQWADCSRGSTMPASAARWSSARHVGLRRFSGERLSVWRADDLHERVERELATEDGRRSKDQPHIRRQKRQTGAHDLADAFGLPSTRPRKPQQLAQEQGVPLGPPLDGVDLVDAGRGAGRLRHEVGHLTLGQASKGQHRRPRATNVSVRPTSGARRASASR